MLLLKYIITTFFWRILSTKKRVPSEELEKRFEIFFGGLKKLKSLVADHAAAVTGSGWVWLVDDGGHLEVISTYGCGTPIAAGRHITPIIAIDLWEHAYYADFMDNRVDYLTAFWNTLNWTAVHNNLLAVPPDFRLLGDVEILIDPSEQPTVKESKYKHLEEISKMFDVENTKKYKI